MLQARRSRVWFPIRSMNCFNLPNPSSHNMALESIQPLTEMSTGKIPGGVKGSGCIRLITLPPSVSWLSRCESLHLSHPYGPSRPVTGTAVPFYSIDSCTNAFLPMFWWKPDSEIYLCMINWRIRSLLHWDLVAVCLFLAEHIWHHKHNLVAGGLEDGLHCAHFK
jgi:hypothetical protein